MYPINHKRAGLRVPGGTWCMSATVGPVRDMDRSDGAFRLRFWASAELTKRGCNAGFHRRRMSYSLAKATDCRFFWEWVTL